MNSMIDAQNIWKYKPNLQVDMSTLNSLKMQAVPEICEMSMRADADRLSVVLGGPKLDELGQGLYHTNSTAAEEDPVLQIHYKSKKLREKHADFASKSGDLKSRQQKMKLDLMQD